MTLRTYLKTGMLALTILPGLLSADGLKDRFHETILSLENAGLFTNVETTAVGLSSRTEETCVELTFPVGSFHGGWNAATRCLSFDLEEEICDWEITTCSDYQTDTWLWLNGPDGLCIEGADDPGLCPLSCSEYDPDVLDGPGSGVPCLPAGHYRLYVHAFASHDPETCEPILCNLPARVCFTMNRDGGTVEAAELPADFELIGAFPNPFNPTTQVHFSLEATQHASIQLADLRGRVIRVLHSGLTASGSHVVTLDAGDLASGTYYVRMLAERGSQHIKILLLK